MRFSRRTRKVPLLIAPVWNWNERLVTLGFRDSFTFNRTSLELKRDCCYQKNLERETFNRTSLELKPARRRITEERRDRLLIAPVWNWNVRLAWRARRFLVPFNRTSLELKHGGQWRGVSNANSLLIAPVWNWNCAYRVFSRKRPRLLIAPVWNWNLLLRFESCACPGDF